MRVEDIARIAHEANRAYCRTIGDRTQAPWEGTATWQKESAIAGVQAILDGRVKTPEQSHEGWLEQKRAEGWTYGTVKDAEKKTHPCFMPYADLPEEQRRKDHIFQAVVLACMNDVC